MFLKPIFFQNYIMNFLLQTRLFDYINAITVRIKKITQYLLLFLIACLLTACAGNKGSVNEGEIAQQLRSQLNEWKGTPYRYGGTTRKGIDCSAFVQITYRDIFRRDLPRSTEDQAQIGQKINKKHLQAGDLVFFKTGSGQDGYHVGIYAENNTFIHASTSKGVIRSSLSNPYWQEHYWHSRRVM